MNKEPEHSNRMPVDDEHHEESDVLNIKYIQSHPAGITFFLGRMHVTKPYPRKTSRNKRREVG